MLLNDLTKHDTAVIIVFFAILFEVERDRGSRNKVFVVSWWGSPVVRNSCGKAEGKKQAKPFFPTKIFPRESWDFEVKKLWLLSDAECCIDSILSS